MIPGECTHYDTKDGPRIPLRWGSAPTVVCRLCGFWRDARSYCTPRWQAPPIPVEDNDDC